MTDQCRLDVPRKCESLHEEYRCRHTPTITRRTAPTIGLTSVASTFLQGGTVPRQAPEIVAYPSFSSTVRALLAPYLPCLADLSVRSTHVFVLRSLAELGARLEISVSGRFCSRVI